MREIKFRGKRVDNGEWVYGSLLQSEIAANGYAKCEIHERFADDPSITRHEVIPESVGQWTGLKDKNTKEIYEGDIVKGGTSNQLYVQKKPQLSVIEYKDHGFWIKEEEFGWEGEGLWAWYDLEVIGNIYESPELLNK